MDNPISEDEVIAALRPWCNFKPSGRFPVDIGDDAAVRVCTDGEQLIITGDTLVEGVDFRTDLMTLSEIGNKAVAVNLSDCAAMGAEPDSILVQVVFPTNLSNKKTSLVELYQGIHAASLPYDLPVIGGDLSRGPCWILSVTLHGRIPVGSRPLLKSGARPGDIIYVSGRCGRSGGGLALLLAHGRECAEEMAPELINAHIKPVAEIKIGIALRENRLVTSCTDISDGVASEASAIAKASGVGMELWAESMRDPLLEKHSEEIGQTGLELFLQGGEDFKLLFTADPTFNPKSLGEEILSIGMVTKAEGVVIRKNGIQTPLPPEGFDHFR